MRYLFILFVVFISSDAICQKTLQKTYDAAALSSLVLKADGVHAIAISSEATENILITTIIHGETYENVVLDIVQTQNTLIITPGLTPFFVPENDKLAAHKVLAIEMTIVMPEDFEVIIASNMAQVKGKGKFKTFNTSLEQGNCRLSQFLGNAKLLSKSGSITVETVGDVRTRKAVSKLGKVFDSLPKGGSFSIVAETISGDITLEQTK